jgi:hypothetical protein
MSEFKERLWRELVREHGDQLAQMRSPAAHSPKKLAGLRRPLFRPRLAAAGALVGIVALNATGAFGLNVFGMHSALTASSLPGGFQSASTATYGLLTETSTTCSSFSSGNSAPLGTLRYTVGSNGTISQVNPPQFYYFVGVTAGTTGTVTYTITETISPSTYKHFLPLISNGTQVYNSNCTKVQGAKISYDSKTGTTTVTFTATAGQTYFLALKYSASNGLVGQPPPPAPGTATYTYATNGGEQASIQLVHK